MVPVGYEEADRSSGGGGTAPLPIAIQFMGRCVAPAAALSRTHADAAPGAGHSWWEEDLLFAVAFAVESLTKLRKPQVFFDVTRA